MNRCVLSGLTALVVAAAALTANAQTPRPFPATALRGVLVVQQPPDVLLNDRPARLSPGSRIRSPGNMLTMSGALMGQELLVNYTLESNGLVHNVWILTPEEAANKPWPTTPEQAQTWLFDPSNQSWTRR